MTDIHMTAEERARALVIIGMGDLDDEKITLLRSAVGAYDRLFERYTEMRARWEVRFESLEWEMAGLRVENNEFKRQLAKKETDGDQPNN